jgi:hypothetical protein
MDRCLDIALWRLWQKPDRQNMITQLYYKSDSCEAFHRGTRWLRGPSDRMYRSNVDIIETRSHLGPAQYLEIY